MVSLVRTVAPTVEPITTGDVIAQARVASDTPELGLVRDYMIAAREWAEAYTERSFLTQTWRMEFDWRFPAEVRLRRGPVSAVSSIAYTDTAGDAQTLSSSLYQVDLASDPPRIRPAYGQQWPEVREQYAAVRVTYVAGYGAAAYQVPQPIRNAITMLAAYWFDQRVPVAEKALVDVPWGTKALLDPYRSQWYGGPGSEPAPSAWWPAA